jgi:hypothetical protein
LSIFSLPLTIPPLANFRYKRKHARFNIRHFVVDCASTMPSAKKDGRKRKSDDQPLVSGKKNLANSDDDLTDAEEDAMDIRTNSPSSSTGRDKSPITSLDPTTPLDAASTLEAAAFVSAPPGNDALPPDDESANVAQHADIEMSEEMPKKLSNNQQKKLVKRVRQDEAKQRQSMAAIAHMSSLASVSELFEVHFATLQVAVDAFSSKDSASLIQALNEALEQTKTLASTTSTVLATTDVIGAKLDTILQAVKNSSASRGRSKSVKKTPTPKTSGRSVPPKPPQKKPTSYASAVSAGSSKEQRKLTQTKTPVTIHTVIVQSKTATPQSSASATKSDFKSVFNAHTASVKVTGIRHASNGSIMVDAASPDALEKIKEFFGNSTLAATYKIEDARKLQPTVILRGVHKQDARNQQVFAGEMLDANPSLKDAGIKAEDIKVLYERKSRHRNAAGTCDVVVRLTPDARKAFLKLDKVHHLTRVVTVEDFVNVTQCFQCLGFGHTASKCQSPAKCSHCSDAHAYKDCVHKADATKAFCTNCHKDEQRINRTRVNRARGGTPAPVTLNKCHSATSGRCKSFQSMKLLIQRRTDYGAR